MSRPQEPSLFDNVPRGHAIRREAAARIRKLRFEWNWERNQRAIRAASVWSRRWACGCVQTGELFDDSGIAARRFKTNTTAISRCCKDGRCLPGRDLQFVWLNGPRWTDLRRRSGAGAGEWWKAAA